MTSQKSALKLVRISFSCAFFAVYFQTAIAFSGPAVMAGPQICDVRAYGAIGDGVTKDTQAIQAAINHCAPGGVVLLSGGGNYLSGTLRLKSDLIFRIESGSKLLGSRDDRDYPDLKTPTQNTQLKQCRKALLYGEKLEKVVIEGAAKGDFFGTPSTSFGAIDGNSDRYQAWTGPEGTRPIALFVALSNRVTIRNLQVVNSGMWSLVNLENTNVIMDNIRVDSHWGPTRDGIDIVDSSHVIIRNCDINSEDDSICLKSGSSKGLHDIIVRDSIIRNSLVANALKVGTASVGEIEGILFEKIRIERAKQAAMAVESVDGAKIHNVHFHDIDFRNAGTSFFVLLGQRLGSSGVGSIDDLHFEDITGETNLDWGSVLSGVKVGTKVYPITNMHFSNVHISSLLTRGGSRNFVAPPEYAGEYPDPRMWAPMPAYGLFVRHVNGFYSNAATITSYPGETRPEILISNGDATMP